MVFVLTGRISAQTRLDNLHKSSAPPLFNFIVLFAVECSGLVCMPVMASVNGSLIYTGRVEECRPARRRVSRLCRSAGTTRRSVSDGWGFFFFLT